jgi:hypothetical protein
MKEIILRENRAVVDFLREYFQTMIKIIPIQIMFKIQYLILINADIIRTILMIVVFIHICIHLFTNNRTQQCYHVISIIFFGGSSSTYDQSNFQENCTNLTDDCNLNVLDVNLSLARAEKQKNIDPTVMELSDDQDEQDDTGPYDSSEIEI